MALCKISVLTGQIKRKNYVSLLRHIDITGEWDDLRPAREMLEDKYSVVAVPGR